MPLCLCFPVAPAALPAALFFFPVLAAGWPVGQNRLLARHILWRRQKAERFAPGEVGLSASLTGFTGL